MNGKTKRLVGESTKNEKSQKVRKRERGWGREGSRGVGGI